MTILTMYYKSEGGGCFKRLRRMILACAERGCVVRYLAPRPFPGLEGHHPHIIWHRAWVFGPEPVRRLLAGALLPLQCLALCARYKVSRIAVFGTFYSAVSFLARVFLGTPVITFLRGYWLDELEWRKAHPVILSLARMMNRIGYRISLILVPNSQSLRDVLVESGVSEDKVILLTNEVPVVDSIDAEAAKVDLCKRLNLPENAFLMSYVGTFKELKRAWFVVDILAQLKDTNAYLLIVGRGVDQTKIEQHIEKHGVADRCRMLGWMDDPGEIYAASDVSLLPSAFEGSPNAMFESIAHGTPVLGAKTRGISDVLPEELCFDVEQPAEAVALVRSLMESETVRTMVQDITCELRQKYTFDWDEQMAHLIRQPSQIASS